MSSRPHPDSSIERGPEPAAGTSRFVEANGLQLHYLDYGAAGRPPMLCVHGGAAHAHWFDFVAPGFNTDYHVRSLDLRGHGDSAWADPPAYFYEDYASDLNEVVGKLGWRDFVLVGHSMGGAVALLYAATYPGLVKTLVVVDSTVNLSPERIAKLRDVGSKPGSSYAAKEDLVSRYRLRPGDSLAAPATIRHVASHSGRQVADGTWKHKFDRNVYATRENFDGMPLWGRIHIPVLLVKGEKSQRLSPEVYAGVKNRCPQAVLAEVAESDHHVTLDNPAGFVRAVRPFLAANG